MNQLKHVLGIPITLPNGIALRGSTISRSAGTSGRHPRKCGKVLVATGDSDDSTEPKLSSRSYARIIADYSKAIEARNATTRLNGERKTSRNKGFFSKTHFHRLARVSSMVNIKNVGNNCGLSLCTKSSSRPPPDFIKINDQAQKNENSNYDAEAPSQASKRAQYLDHVVRAYNAKRMTKNSSSIHYCHQGKHFVSHLVQRLPESNGTRNAITKCIKGCHSSSVKKITDTSVKDVKNMSRSSKSGSTSPKGCNDSRERYCSCVKKMSGSLARDANNVSVVVQRLQEADKSQRDLLTRNSGDSNAMLVTVTEESKSSSTSQSSPLRHIDLRINGKPAMGVDTVISKVNKLDVVSSAEKVEITIPVLSKSEGGVGDNERAPNSMINLYISGRGKESKGLNGIQHIAGTGQVGDCLPGSSKSDLMRPSTLVSSKIGGSRKSESAYQSKVVPWWTTAESFRCSEITGDRLNEMTPITRNVEMMKPSVEKWSARGNEVEARDGEEKEVAISDTGKAPKLVVTKPSSPRQQQQQDRRKGASVISKIIASESVKRSEREGKGWQKHERVTLGRSKSDARLEAKADTKVRSTETNEPKKETPPEAVGWTMPGKSDRASAPTLDGVSKKMASSSGSTVAASGGESMTVEFKLSKHLGTIKNNNLSSGNSLIRRNRDKPISEIARNANASVDGGTTFEGRASGDVTSSKTGTKSGQEVTSKSKISAGPLLPSTYGKIRLLAQSQSPTKPVNLANNNRCVPVKPSDGTANTSGKVSKLKNRTIAMRPIEKKQDGTLIDYGITVDTRKKPGRKLSGSESTAGLWGKKLVKQKEDALVATVKEILPCRNRDTRSGAINPRAIDDTARTGLNGPDKNERRTNEPRASPCGPENTASKGTTNEPNESTNSRTSVKSEKRHSRGSNESQVVEAGAPDKKLLYSVWLRRFKERTGEDPDPTRDPSSRNS